VEQRNGKPTSALSEAVDYSRVLHNGVPRDVLESLLDEHDEAKQQELIALRRQVGELSAAIERLSTNSGGDEGASNLRAEITQFRQEFATAIASLRSVVTQGDGDLHEMQLTSLRRQISQLEGVLESNYQRELRVAEDRETALRSEMAQMRQDLRVALETLYRMPGESDNSSANDDLRNLEKQVDELGASLVRAANEQQRAALERETTLKAELAHMRRDLLVTLEASYQLPTDRLQGLDEQITSWRGQVEELQLVILGMQEAQDQTATRQRATLEHEMHELRQQIQMTLEASMPQSEHEELLAQHAVLTQLAERLDEEASGTGLHFERLNDIVSGRSSALEAEFATLRTDLQTSVDALTARIETAPESPGLAAIESLHERLQDLQTTVNTSEERSRTLAAEREQHVAAELASIKSDLDTSIGEIATRVETASHGATLDALGEMQAQLAEMQHALAARDEHAVALLAEREQTFTAAVDERLASLRADLRTAVESLSEERADSFGPREREALLTLEQSLAQSVVDTRARDEHVLTLQGDIADLQRDVAAVAEAVSSGPGTVDHSSDLEALRNTLAALHGEVAQSREEQRTLLGDHARTVHDELAASQEVLLETSIAFRDAESSAPTLTLEAIGEIVSARLKELDGHWNEAQTEQYRQLVSQIAEVQLDLDNVSTGMQAIQPVENPSSGSDAIVVEQLQAILQSLHSREVPSDNSTSIDEFNRLRYEIQGLRSDLTAALEVASSRASDGTAGAPDFSLDDLVRVIATQLNAGKAEGDRLAANRDQVLRHELSQIRQDVQGAVQQSRASASNGGTAGSAVELSELQSGIAEIRAGLARIPDSTDNELRGEVAQLRQELHSTLDSVVAAATAHPVVNDEVDNPLLERVAELERTLQASQQEQRQWLEERDAAVYSQLEALSASLKSSGSTDQAPAEEAWRESWHEDLTQLHDQIATLAQQSEMQQASNDLPVLDLMGALRTEMQEALESMRAWRPAEAPASPDSSSMQEGLMVLATSLQQSSANQQSIMESQQQAVQAALTQMREDMRSALSGLTRESIDTFEKRQSQLRMDQLEMERNLAQLRQELVATQADPSNKKKLWR
jgi:hypothetical protein